MLTQIEELKSFIVQATTLTWKGPSSMTYDRVDSSTQIHAIKAYAAKFVSKHVMQEVSKENNNPQISVPGSGARHTPSNRKSIEGIFVNK